MEMLTQQRLLKLWEKGASLHPIDRALLILTTAYPTEQWKTLASLSIGQRNYLLLQVREKLFGHQMDCFIQCVNCGKNLDFVLDTRSLLKKDELFDKAETREVKIGKITLTFRLVNSNDLAAIVKYDDLKEARQCLIQRCLLNAKQKRKTILFSKLSKEIVNKLIQKMQDCDPLGEVMCHFHCPVCDEKWQGCFDIVNFLWEEIASQGKQFLEEIAYIAMHYGWSEQEILSMNPVRRNFYLNRVNI